MSKRRLVVTAVTVQGLSQAEVARRYGVSQGWVSRVLARWRAEGEAAFEPASRRPRSSPNATAPEVVNLVLALRKDLTGQGLDAGAHTICWHLHHHHGIEVSAATVWRILSRHGQVTPEPRKRPKASLTRFAAELPNQMWQTDFTHYRLADGSDAQILSFLDDHSRYLLTAIAYRTVNGPAVRDTFRATVQAHGVPASVLSDNGMVFTSRFAAGRATRVNGRTTSTNTRNAFEAELAHLGVTQKNSSPGHPQTCGKIERYHQTLKKWLTARPAPATVTDLQALLDVFADQYNHHRPHRGIGRRTPAAAYAARPKATPPHPDTSTDDPGQDSYRVRHDKIDTTGVVTLRHHGRLHHIGIGRTHARTHVILLIHDLHIQVIHATTGELLRELDLDPTKDYQPTGRPPGPQKQ